MAKSKASSTHQHPSKPKTSLFLCCFGSSHALDSSPTKDSFPISDMKKKKKRKTKSTITSWFSWLRIRFNKKSSHKTVPFESSITSHHHAHDSKTKSKSKSTLPHKAQPPATTSPPPPTQPASVLPATPFYTPTQTRHGVKHNAEDTRQQGRGSPAQAKRPPRRLPSTAVQTQTTFKKGRNDGVVGMSVVAVTLVIMIFWGRLCAILCTSLWLYSAPRFQRIGGINDDGNPKTTPSNDVDLDSEEYKKQVIMKGLLGRNHRTVL
ncbi:hypothetical protein VNO80_23845 [Phaseolus coccineus]|uniref:Transmembrane protein n=1 Tax=Phaseolus coccineus TaxID=3886 RepID=A0AAN9MBW5_PHACN